MLKYRKINFFLEIHLNFLACLADLQTLQTLLLHSDLTI